MLPADLHLTSQLSRNNIPVSQGIGCQWIASRIAMETAVRIREWCHLWEGHQRQIYHLEWFLGRDSGNQALSEKINHLKVQSDILIELIRAELRPDSGSQSGA
jgi:hypothetical protein